MLHLLVHSIVLSVPAVGDGTLLSPESAQFAAAPVARETVRAVISEYQEAFSDWLDSYSGAAEPEERAALVERLPRPDDYAPRLLAIVERAPQAREAYTALSWIYGESKGRELRDEALERLIADFGGSLRVTGLVPTLERDGAGTAWAALQRLAASSPHGKVRAMMLLGTAGWLVRHGTRSDREKCEEILGTVIREYGDVEISRRITGGDDARRRLFEVRHLLEGCTAPSLEGVGLDGAPISLAAQRGKVIVLTFWATWCTGCLHQVPDERELMKEYVDRPFVLLGINADRATPKEVIAKAETIGVTWRSFRNDSAGLDGPITSSWNVRTLPTTYVIGHDGRIVRRWAGGIAKPDELRTAVAAAVALAVAAEGR